MSEENASALERLRDKLDKFKETLSDEQKELLHAVLELAREVSADEDTLELGFDGSFRPDDASLIIAYMDGGGVPTPTMIKGGLLGLIKPHPHP
jgi:hypothetical protein